MSDIYGVYASGNLLTQVYDTAGAQATTTYSYDGSNRLASVTRPDGTTVAYTYTSSGQRASTTLTPPGGGSASVITDDYYQFGQLAYQTDGAGTLLASYTYDSSGAPESVQVGSDPANAPRYYYVYDARGDVVNLTDASGAVVASYAYDTWGLTSSSETIPNANGWVNPYRYDGRDGVRSDAATGLDWMTTRAYDPTLGRFLARDPLGRAPLYLSDNPYVYAGNNPLSNVDPSGQYRATGQGAGVQPESWSSTNQMIAHIVSQSGCDRTCEVQQQQKWVSYHLGLAKGIANDAIAYFSEQITGPAPKSWGLVALIGTPIVTGILKELDTFVSNVILPQFTAFTIGWGTIMAGVAAYDTVAVLGEFMFWEQTQQTDSYWLNAGDLRGVWAGFGISITLIATFFTVLSMALLALAPENSPLVIGLTVGIDAAMLHLLPHFKAYIDQEEQALGYAQV